VLYGGYEDDEDYGDVIVYTGHGGQNQTSRKKQIADQKLTQGNLALAISMQQGLPVRVIRGSTHQSSYAPSSGYRYDGLYTVELYWHEKGAAGFKVWRYRLVRRTETAPIEAAVANLELSGGNSTPGRSKTSVCRVIRDTALSVKVKRLYGYTCQVCSTRLTGPAGPYAEAAHVRPLGRPHNGPDTPDNLVCLCPNHHYLFDIGAFSVREDLSLVGLSGRLFVHKTHPLNVEHLRYHREHFGLIEEIDGPGQRTPRR
jgi:putative restriction endonuclease